MLEWIKIEINIPLTDIVMPISVKGTKLTFVKDQGKVFVFQSKCPHAGGLLFDGWCKEHKLVCPIHRYTYDLETGRGGEGQGDYIRKYPLKIKEDGIYIGFKIKWWKKLFS